MDFYYFSSKFIPGNTQMHTLKITKFFDLFILVILPLSFCDKEFNYSLQVILQLKTTVGEESSAACDYNIAELFGQFNAFLLILTIAVIHMWCMWTVRCLFYIIFVCWFEVILVLPFNNSQLLKNVGLSQLFL